VIVLWCIFIRTFTAFIMFVPIFDVVWFAEMDPIMTFSAEHAFFLHCGSLPIVNQFKGTPRQGLLSSIGGLS